MLSALVVAAAACGNNGDENESLPDARQIQSVIDAAPEAALLREDPEPAGTNCPAGGTAVHSGIDVNHDGILEDSEIQSTIYICNTPSATVIEGSVVIGNSLEAATLIGVTSITGNLTIDAAGLETLDLSSLQSLGGTLAVLSFSGTEIEGAALTTMGGIVVGGNQEENLAPLATLSFPVLTTITDDVEIVDRGSAIATFNAPVLATVGGRFDIGQQQITSLSLPLLTSVGEEFDVDHNSARAAVSAPLLTSVGADFDIVGNSVVASLDVSLLATVGGALDVDSDPLLAALNVPLLTTAQSVEIYSDTALTMLSIGSLATISNTSGNGNGGCDIGSNDALVSLDFAALGSVVGGGFDIDDNAALTSVRAPLLTSVDAELDIGANPVLASVGANALTSVGGYFQIVGDVALPSVNFPALVSVTADGTGFAVDNDDVLTSLNLPSLTTAGGGFDISNDAVLTSVDFPALSAVVGSIDLTGDPELQLLSFATLTSVGGDLSSDTNANVVTISIPVLTAVGGTLSVNGSTSMTAFSAPALTNAGNINFDADSVMASFSVPELATVTTNLWLSNGGDGLVSLSFPSLTFAGDVYISSEPSLATLAAPALTSVSPQYGLNENGIFYVTDSPNMAACEVEALGLQCNAHQIGSSGDNTSILCN